MRDASPSFLVNTGIVRAGDCRHLRRQATAFGQLAGGNLLYSRRASNGRRRAISGIGQP